MTHRATRRRWIVPLTVVASFSLIFGSFTPASGQPSGSTSTLLDAGVLRLQLGATDRFRYEPTPGSSTGAIDQSVSAAGNCRLTLGSSSNLVGFSATPGGAFPGFVSDAIGVRSGGEGGGQPCGRIDPGQTLTMDLGTDLSGKVIDFAEIDLELKFSGAVTITGKLVQGGTATTMASETYASVGSDSGPDSGDGDNYRVRFPRSGKTAVNRLVFSVGSAGSGSLEGGADGTGFCDAADAAGCDPAQGGSSLGQSLNTTDTLFHLTQVDGVLDCTTNNTATQGGSGTPSSTLTRVENVGGATCTPIPFNLDSSVTSCPDPTSLQCILLQKDLLGQSAQFLWHVVWVPEPGVYQETDTQFDYGFGYQDLQLCLADGPDVGSFPDLPPKAATSPPGSPDPDPWCVISTSTTLNPATGLVTVDETYFGANDPVGHR